MTKYQRLTDEMFNDMMSSDAGIREARYATGYGRWLNGESVTDGHYVNWPDYRSKWEISEEQREVAMQRFEERKAQVLERVSEKGVLCFHAMGMDYEPTTEDGIGNYRIRANFKDKSGHEWFIELHPCRNENADADEAKGARDLMEISNHKMQRMIELAGLVGWNIAAEDMAEANAKMREFKEEAIKQGYIIMD